MAGYWQNIRGALANQFGSKLVGHLSGNVHDELKMVEVAIPGRTISLSEVMSKTVTGGNIVVNCYGDSMTYGQDTVSTTGDLQPGINGSSATRALYQYPEAMGAALTKAGFNVTVNNYGFPGDTAVQGKTRFPSAAACDIAFVMFGHNDANDVAGSPATSPENYKAAIDFIIRREQANGAFVILLTPPRLKQSNYSVVVNRQRWMRVFESIIHQLGTHYGIPVISVDELVGHRGTEIYCDDIHFNKYGYNEWGWNLSAALIQRSSAPKRIGHGTVIQAAGSSITGSQTLLNGKTVLTVGTNAPLCVSGFFEEDVVARVFITYNTGVGGAQRVKATICGGSRNGPVSQMRITSANAAPGKVLHSDVIKRGYRTLFLEAAGTTTVAYIDRVEFERPQRLFTDTAGDYCKSSSIVGLSLPLESELNRWVIDDAMPLIGDFTLSVDLTTAPGAGDSSGISLVSEFGENDGVPNRFLSIMRISSVGGFIRLNADGTNDDTSLANVFMSAPTIIKIVREGDTFSIYGDSLNGTTLLATKMWPAGRLLPAVFRNNAAVSVNKYTAR